MRKEDSAVRYYVANNRGNKISQQRAHDVSTKSEVDFQLLISITFSSVTHIYIKKGIAKDINTKRRPNLFRN